MDELHLFNDCMDGLSVKIVVFAKYFNELPNAHVLAFPDVLHDFLHCGQLKTGDVQMFEFCIELMFDFLLKHLHKLVQLLDQHQVVGQTKLLLVNLPALQISNLLIDGREGLLSPFEWLRVQLCVPV